MRISRIPVEVDDDEPVSHTRLWRRPGVWLLAALGLVVVYILVRPVISPPQPANKQNRSADAFIGEVVGYQPPARLVTPAHAQDRADQLPDPPKTATVQTPAPEKAAITPQATAETKKMLPDPPSIRSLMPPTMGQKAPSIHTRMLVYDLPPPTPKPTTPPPEPETTVGFKTATLPGLKASAAIDDTYQLMPGILPLVLDSAIQSDVPGPFFAHTPGPVYSTRQVLLMDANTNVVGHYEGMGKGSRMQATGLVAYVRRPEGMVWVPLSGQPMGDDLGRAGLSGEVDNHILQRFAPAVLLTVTDQALQIIQAEASKGGNTYLNLQGGGGGVGSLAQQILQSQINIPATFTKHHGETMALLLDQPIDFSASTRIRVVKAPP